MRIRFVVLLAVLILAAPALAQQPGERIRVSLHPAAVPRPSMKYRLLPAPAELIPGNAATGYGRALAGLYENKAVFEEMRKPYWGEWLSKPLAEFPLEEARQKVKMCSNLLREVGYAARRRSCDWGLEGRPEGMGLLLPDAQAYRTVGTMLAVKARCEIAARDFDGAVHTLQTGFALGRHLGEAPLFIHILIGAAVVNIMHRQVDEFIQQPGAPNLYWALTALPRPYFTLDRALREEPDTVERTLPFLRKVEGTAWTAEDVKAAEAQREKMFDDFGMRRSDEGDDAHRAIFEGAYDTAKKALLDSGIPAVQVNAMPKIQVIALHAVREYRLASDEVAKWNHVIGGWRHPGFAKDAQRYSESSARLDLLFFRGLLGGLAGGHTPSAPKMADAIDRVDRRIAAQRCLEAIRAHAAAHGGKLPAKLDEITELPIPADPMLRQPFEYKRTGDHTATLSASPPAQDKDNKALTLVYELTLATGK